MDHYPTGLYNSIADGDIRLLRINADTAALNVGSLKVVALNCAPLYYALSHCWGIESQSIAIQIDGYPFLLNPELAAGIRRLQELAAEKSGMDPPIEYIWIDKICINQDDHSERSSQVRLMGHIYSQAIRTLVWLGPEQGSYSMAWKLVDRIYNLFRTQYPNATNLTDISLKMYSDTSHASFGLPRWNDNQWLYLRELMGLRWFSRIWVIQEVVLSSQDPIILHGKVSYQWHRLGWVAAWMRRKGYMRLSEIAEEFRNVDTICALRRAESRWPLDALLSITQIKFHATDQRDKIYGLLGLTAEFWGPSKLPDSLHPDYDSDVTEVYRRVARYLLEQNHSLAILTRARGTSGSSSRKLRQYDLDLPSWAPDWSDFKVFGRGIRTSLSWIHYSNITEPARLGFPKNYSASAELELKLYEVADDSILRVGGMKLDEVVQVVPFNTDNFSKEEAGDTFSSQIVRVLEAAISLLKDMEIASWASQFIKTTSAEQHHLVGKTWDQLFKDGLSFLHNLLLHNEAQMLLFLSQCGGEKTLDLLYNLSTGGMPGEYAVLARNFTFHRSFIITSGGKMGLGPSDTRVHDTISVIPGGNVPYIIRQQGLGWTFVGESYVAGLMNGEAIEAYQQCLVQQIILDFR